MIKVIEHGYKKYCTYCSICNCYFEYDVDDVNSNNIVKCPDCKRDCYHSTLNADVESQFEDNTEVE